MVGSSFVSLISCLHYLTYDIFVGPTDVIPIWATKEVMMSLSSSVARQACRIWLYWNSKIRTLLVQTAPYNVCICETGSDDELNAKWTTMVQASLLEWEKMVQLEAILGEGEDHEDDYGEHEAEDDDEFDT